MSCIRVHGTSDLCHQCADNHHLAPGCVVTFAGREDDVGTIISVSNDFDDEVLGTDITVLWDIAPKPLTMQEKIVMKMRQEEDRAYLRLMKDSLGT